MQDAGCRMRDIGLLGRTSYMKSSLIPNPQSPIPNPQPLIPGIDHREQPHILIRITD